MSEKLRGTKMPYEMLQFNFGTLMNDFLSLQTQIDRELKDNNGLRESIMIYSKAFEKIETLAFGEEGEWVDIINKISKDLHEAILAK